MNKKEMNNKGFSLVELIIVIAIMAILVGVLAPQFIKYVQKSRIAKDVQNAEEVKTTIEVYAAGHEGLSAPVVVTCAANKLTISGGAEITADNLSIPSLDVTLSSTWTKSGNAKFTFSDSSYTWTADGDLTVTHDGTTYKMSDVF